MRLCKALLDALPEPLALVNREGGVTLANHAFEQSCANALCGISGGYAEEMQLELMNALAETQTLASYEQVNGNRASHCFNLMNQEGLCLQASLTLLGPILVLDGAEQDTPVALLKLLKPSLPLSSNSYASLPRRRETLLIRDYKLTPAEARLACELMRWEHERSGGTLERVALHRQDATGCCVQ